MRFEILFPEFYIYGEKANLKYLELLFPEDEFHHTLLNDELKFLTNDADVLIMGPMAEHYLSKVTEKLAPFKAELKQWIDSGKYLFVENNAMDIFGKILTDSEGRNLPTLDLFPYTTHRDYENRAFSQFFWKIGDVELVGAYSGFARYGIDPKDHWYTVSADSKGELGGYREKNAFALEVISQILITNPPLSLKLRELLGKEPYLPFEKEVWRLYESKKAQYKKAML